MRYIFPKTEIVLMNMMRRLSIFNPKLISVFHDHELHQTDHVPPVQVEM